MNFLEKLAAFSPNATLPITEGPVFTFPISAITGYAFGKVFKVNPVFTTIIFTVQNLADNLFYQLGNHFLSPFGINSHKIYWISTGVNHALFFLMLNQLDLIDNFYTTLLFLAALARVMDHAAKEADTQNNDENAPTIKQ
jgi:hypothetical protein